MINKEKTKGASSTLRVMFKITIGLVVIGILLFFIPTASDKFAVFNINDISKPISFIDSVSAPHQKNNNFVLIKITGEIDADAKVAYGAKGVVLIKGKKTPKFQMHTSFPLSKGKINIDVRHDYYSGDTLQIFFTPKGCKKGWLKIQTQIN